MTTLKPAPHAATEEARQSIAKQSEDAARLAELLGTSSPLKKQQLVEVVCPAGATPGQHIEAETAAGRMHVTIPDGVKPGQKFLARRAPAVGAASAKLVDYDDLTDSTAARYHQLLADGARLLAEDRFVEAAKAFEAACKVDPECPTGYFNLAVTQKRQGEVVQAAAMYLIAQKSMEPGSEHWAIATARVFGCLVQVECAEVEKPSWWSDGGLKALSAQLIEAAPEQCEVWHMRARVLSAMPDQPGAWEAGPRTAAELQESAEAYRRTGCLTPDRQAAIAFADKAEEMLCAAIKQIDLEIEEEEADDSVAAG